MLRSITTLIIIAALTTGAAAQIKFPPKPKFPMPLSPLIAAPAEPVDPIGDLSKKIDAVKVDAVNGIIAALKEADADAATLLNPSDPASFRDPISHACYPEQIKFLQSLPVSQPIQSPAPFNLIVLFQRKRDFVAQIKAGLPPSLRIGCAAMLGDEVATLAKTLALVGVTVSTGGLGGILPAAAPLAFPAILP